MLCSNQQCSYHHWVHHANYKVNQNTKSQRTNPPDRRIFDKKDVIIGKILHEYRQKPPPTRSKKKKHSDGQLVHPDRGVKRAKYPSQESILIPKDPTSPYAFTLNGNSRQKKTKKNVIDQACCVILIFLMISVVSMVSLIIYLSQCTHAMTSGMT